MSLRRIHVPFAAAVAALVAAAALLLVALPERADTPGGAVERLAFERAPYLGVSCPEPNAIECGRVGLGVWLREPASRVEARVAGESAVLSSPQGEGRFYQGFVQRRGFIRGTLGVRPDRPNGDWWGTHAPSVRVVVTAFFAGGERAVRRVRVPLAPGFG